MKAKFINDFHHTEIEIEVIETAVCGPEGLETLCAYFSEAQLKKVGHELCGISGCCCGGWSGRYCEGEDGKKYFVQISLDKNPAAVALGSHKSPAKTAAARENAKRPRPNARGKKKPRKPKTE